MRSTLLTITLIISINISQQMVSEAMLVLNDILEDWLQCTNRYQVGQVGLNMASTHCPAIWGPSAEALIDAVSP
jgi:hypothetical protein